MLSSSLQKKETSEESYNEIPYLSTSYPQTHPSHIRAVATLLGLEAPALKNARVLEIGCAGGGNLLPLALLYPNARFLGIDFSQAQIDEALTNAAALKLGNIEFKKQDILTFTTTEKFDYIIAHGVFSWVPDNVRQQVLKICNDTLSPNGLAVISYNTLPGWGAVRGLRDMMLYHTRSCTSEKDRVMQARLFLESLRTRIPDVKTNWRATVETISALFSKNADSYIAHDFLEKTNEPFYFHAFADMLDAHSLTCVADANLHMNFIGESLISEIADPSGAALNAVDQEQYADFICNREFRTSIIARQGRSANKTPPKEKILDYFLSAAPDISLTGADPRESMRFTNAAGNNLDIDNLGINVMMLELIDAGPVPVSADELIARIQTTLGLKDATPVRAALIEYGLFFVMNGFIALHADRPACATSVSKNPVAFPLARLQAAQDHLAIATSVMGRTVPLQSADKLVLQCLDGTRTSDDVVNVLLDDIRKNIAAGTLNRPAQDESQMRDYLTGIVRETLPRLAKEGLLVG